MTEEAPAAHQLRISFQKEGEDHPTIYATLLVDPKNWDAAKYQIPTDRPLGELSEDQAAEITTAAQRREAIIQVISRDMVFALAHRASMKDGQNST